MSTRRRRSEPPWAGQPSSGAPRQRESGAVGQTGARRISARHEREEYGDAHGNRQARAGKGEGVADPERAGGSPSARPGPSTRYAARGARPGRSGSAPVTTALAPERLQKVLSQAGVGSRREVEAWILAGRVSVNGLPAAVGQKVSATDKVRISGKLVSLRTQRRAPRILLYHKPEGEIVSRDDPRGRPRVFDRLPRLRGGRWVAVGRLDISTSGLILFTTSGELANRLMHPRYGLQREYAVRLVGELTAEQRESLVSGVMLDDGIARLGSVIDKGGEGTNRWYHVTIGEGRNREVRRMFEALGLTVSRLIRVGYGPIRLPPRLKRGMTMELSEHDVRALETTLGVAGADAGRAAKPTIRQPGRRLSTPASERVRRQSGSRLRAGR